MRRFKLAKGGKILVFLLLVVLIGVGIWQGVDKGFIKMKDKNVSEPLENKNDDSSHGNVLASDSKTNVTEDDSAIINISLDEWIG